jgi:large subunit ribosomal protein L31e
MATLERTYVVPLRKGFVKTPRWKRAKRAVSILRIFLQKHTKRDDVKIGMHLNEFMWKHGIKNPPHHVKVDVWIEDDYAKAELHGQKFKEAVKMKKKEDEPKTLKDKLTAKLGAKAGDESEKSDDTKTGRKEEVQEEKKEENKDTAAADKKDAKPAVKSSPKSTPVKKKDESLSVKKEAPQPVKKTVKKE